MARQRLRYMNRHGLNVRRLEAGETTAPVYPPLNIKASAAPSGTAESGDIYYDSTALTLKLHNGTSYVDAGGIQIQSFQIKPFATVTEYDLMVCPRALKVTKIDVVPSTLQGGALTATIVKSTGTATPVKTTTPLHTADSINLNTGAYTVQSVTLTATVADLSFAAGERLGIDFSAAYTAGHSVVTVSYVYV